MITISEITKRNEDVSRIEVILNIEENNGKKVNYPLFIETSKEWGRYFVTDRADAFVVGILLYAMGKGHDIKCVQPISAELKVKLEKDLIFTLCKNDNSYYHTRIIADVVEEPVKNEGAVGTGISLGLDSFCTIAEHYQCEAKSMRLTHLLTLQNGAVGGFYQNNNWDYCASKLFEREQKVAAELGLPLVVANTNLTKFMARRVDWYVSYWLAMIVMSLGKLFSTYFISSIGVGYANFDITNRFNKDCEYYDLLSLQCFSVKNGIRFLCGGGAYDRVDKIRIISDFNVAQENLQSCLTQHFNCMNCMKCKRNLVTMDALGVLDKFSKVYDIDYYNLNRDEYIEWMCTQVNNNGHDHDYIKTAYDMIKNREPSYIAKFERDSNQFISQYTEMKRQRKVYRKYSELFRHFITKPDAIYSLKQWFSNHSINHVILYGVYASDGVQILISLQKQIGFSIDYIVDNPKEGINYSIPRLREDTINYPNCDAIIICNVDKPEMIRRKLMDFVSSPIYEISEILQ